MVFTKDFLKDLPDTYVGEYTYGAPTVDRLYSGCKLTIGKFCSIAGGVTFAFWGKHQMNDITTYPFCAFTEHGWTPVTRTEPTGEHTYVGNDIWLARNALIMQGVTIGDGAVIGANSVVASNVRPYALVVGNPAREVRRRFSDESINKLMELQWWDWSIENINKYLQLISSSNIDELYETWRNNIKI
jgi:virginiamycin A acetyltransferase